MNLSEIIVKDNNPKLRIVTKELDVDLISESDSKKINSMITYINVSFNNEAEKYNITPGIGIAGPQVGLDKKVTYIRFGNETNEIKLLLANPKIISKSEEICYLQTGEACLSDTEQHPGIVPRNYRININAYDLLNKKEITFEVCGFLAICLQHEIDHLYGTLYYDHINKIDPNHVEEEWIKI